MKKLAREDGFTIMEVMVAVVILTLSLLVLLNMAMIALDGNDWSNRATMSTQLIQSKLEELRTGVNFANGSDSVSGVARSWTIQSAGNHLRRVDITASWRDHSGNVLQNSMTSYIRTDSI